MDRDRTGFLAALWFCKETADEGGQAFGVSHIGAGEHALAEGAQACEVVDGRVESAGQSGAVHKDIGRDGFPAQVKVQAALGHVLVDIVDVEVDRNSGGGGFDRDAGIVGDHGRCRGQPFIRTELFVKEKAVPVCPFRGDFLRVERVEFDDEGEAAEVEVLEQAIEFDRSAIAEGGRIDDHGAGEGRGRIALSCMQAGIFSEDFSARGPGLVGQGDTRGTVSAVFGTKGTIPAVLFLAQGGEVVDARHTEIDELLVCHAKGFLESGGYGGGRAEQIIVIAVHTEGVCEFGALACGSI